MSKKKYILSEKQKAFGREYVFDWNATQAAIRAGYSPKTAKEQACRLLTNVNLQEYISNIQKDIAKLAGISILSQISELKKVAMSNISLLHKDWITRKEFEDLPENVKASISEISTQIKTILGKEDQPMQVEFVKIKLHNKLEAIKEINKMLGYYEPEKQDITSGGEKINQETTVKFINARQDKND